MIEPPIPSSAPPVIPPGTPPPKAPAAPGLATKHPFSWYAARIGLGATIACILAERGSQQPPGSPEALGAAIFCGLLLLVGLAFSIVGIVGVFRHGRKGILPCAALGLGLNVVIIVGAVVVGFILHPRILQSFEDKIAGTWTCCEKRTAGATTLVLDLRPDRGFHLTMSGSEAADCSGTWHVDRTLSLTMQFEDVAIGDPAIRGKQFIWRIEEFDGSRMAVMTRDGREVYQRR